jgi:hypothetical protein
MNFLRSFGFNFLAVFFINQMAPGIEVGLYEQVPNIGADLLFSFSVGLLNASVFPLLFIMELGPNPRKIACLTCLISFTSFIAIALFPFGIQAVSVLGIIIGGCFVWGAGFLTNYLEWRQDILKP